jgi:hypothetical protein
MSDSFQEKNVGRRMIADAAAFYEWVEIVVNPGAAWSYHLS